MQKYLDEITKCFQKNNMTDLTGVVNEKKFLFSYAFYHYYNCDDDRLLDIVDNCPYSKEFHNNYAQGFFEAESYEEKIIDILVPYYLEEEDEFDIDKLKNMIGQVQALILNVKTSYFSNTDTERKLRELWDPSEECKLVIRVITNYAPEFDEKNDLHDIVDRISPLVDNLKFEILFGNEFEDEVNQLTSDKKCVEQGTLTLDKPNNYLEYGDENSIITNITAFSLKENYIKYGKNGLFAMNLRFYVPNKRVDQGLEESIKEKGENFWYYNNGIIIVCDDYQIDGTTVNLTNYSIVNGGQTTRMIGEIPFEHDFAISCKIIKNKYSDDDAKNFKFVSEVAEASNTQKPINSTDIIANRYEQRLLKQRLADNGIFLQIKRGDASMVNLKENYPHSYQRVKNDELAQFLYAGICQKPGTARNSKAKLFSDANKYRVIFNDTEHMNLDFIKDLLFIKDYYKKWQKEATKSNDRDKIGLSKNGFLYTLASIVLMSKFYYSKELCEFLKANNPASDKGTFVISQKTFNHRLFNDDYEGLKNRLFELFDRIYAKYLLKNYNIVKSIKPDIVPSNFTKTDKNYINNIVTSIYDDFAYGITHDIEAVMAPLFYQENAADKIETTSLVGKALTDSDKPAEVEEDVEDITGDTLRDKLKEYRTKTYKEVHVKAYEVFTNAELESLVRIKPRSVNDLLKYGCFNTYPRSKTRKYGQDIINVIISVVGEE